MSLAHELSHPLTAILNNAEVAQQHLETGAIDVAKLRDIVTDIVADDKRAGGIMYTSISPPICRPCAAIALSCSRSCSTWS